MGRADTDLGQDRPKTSRGATFLKAVGAVLAVLVAGLLAVWALIAYSFSQAGQGVGGSEDVDVVITEGAWAAAPTRIDPVGTIDMTFFNEGGESHWPIVVSVRSTVAEVEAELAAEDTPALVDELFGERRDDARVQLDHGSRGHDHPETIGQLDLPDDALLRNRGDTIDYLYTDAVAPGDSYRSEVDRFEGFAPGTAVVILCMNPDHAGRSEYAVIGVTES